MNKVIELTRNERQQVVVDWAEKAFGTQQATDVQQRAIRFLEEAIETFQAAGCFETVGLHLLRYVFSRPKGDLFQELGGVGVTTLALAHAAGFSADTAEITEIERVLAKPIEEFTQRNQDKNNLGFSSDTLKIPNRY